MAGKKTSAKTIYIFVVSSILLILGVAYLFMPPPRGGCDERLRMLVGVNVLVGTTRWIR